MNSDRLVIIPLPLVRPLKGVRLPTLRKYPSKRILFTPIPVEITLRLFNPTNGPSSAHAHP